jgi:short-subunit dehydrogenase
VSPPGAALITGASSGIGEAIALQLAGEGRNLILVGRDARRLDGVAQACRALGVECRAAAMDIRDRAAFADLVRQAEEKGPIDLFVSNAGILEGRRDGEVVETGASARRVLDTNLMAAVDAIHAILPSMRAHGEGRIVLVSSLAAFAPLADAPAYSASKFGLLAYGLALRDALHDERISVTVACPGYVATRMASVHLGHRPSELTPAGAAAKILKAARKRKALCGFPAYLYWSSRISLFIPEKIRRAFTKSIRFHVGG